MFVFWRTFDSIQFVSYAVSAQVLGENEVIVNTSKSVNKGKR